MRVIKFRGKTESGNWVCGNLSILNKGISDFISAGAYISNPAGSPFAYAVNPDTVSQFTGLLDKNGKEIYEGDILSVCNGSINLFPWMDKPYSVEYKINKGFIMPMFLWDKDGNDYSDSTHWCEVIGNKFDNPELLKGEQE